MNFIVEGIFRERARIGSDLFESVSKPTIGMSMPLSNVMILTFKNGLTFRFRGGAQSREDIQELIRDLINSQRRFSASGLRVF